MFGGMGENGYSPHCHSDDRREEESRKHPLIAFACVTEILHFALDDTKGDDTKGNDTKGNDTKRDDKAEE